MGIARAIVVGNNNGCPTRHEDPRPSHLLLEEKSSKCAGLPCGTPRGRGVLISLPRRRPRRPRHRPRQRSCHVLCSIPRRLPCGTCTAPSVGAGWVPGQPRSGFRGVERGSTLPLLLPPPFFNPCFGTKCRPQKGVAFGHINAADWRLSGSRASPSRSQWPYTTTQHIARRCRTRLRRAAIAQKTRIITTPAFASGTGVSAEARGP